MIGIFTYDAPHRKTQDVLRQLYQHGYRDLILLVLPWQDRPARASMYPHRVEGHFPISVDQLAEYYGVPSLRAAAEDMPELLAQKSIDLLVIAGAGILPAQIVSNYRVLNVHPGHLPEVRGLDALKWAILKNLPTSVTAHVVDASADQGWLVAREEVPLYREDSFESFVERHYRYEIDMFVEAVRRLMDSTASMVSLQSAHPVHKRMSVEQEIEMMHAFLRRRDQAPFARKEQLTNRK